MVLVWNSYFQCFWVRPLLPHPVFLNLFTSVSYDGIKFILFSHLWFLLKIIHEGGSWNNFGGKNEIQRWDLGKDWSTFPNVFRLCSNIPVEIWSANEWLGVKSVPRFRYVFRWRMKRLFFQFTFMQLEFDDNCVFIGKSEFINTVGD